MLLLSWLEALKSGFVRGHVRRQARRIDDASRWGTVWVAPKGEVLEDRALLATITVSQDDLNGWVGRTGNASGITTPMSSTGSKFVDGPAVPPTGLGSVNLFTAPGQGNFGAELRTQLLNGTSLLSVTSISYSTYATQWNGQQLPWLRFYVDVDNNSTVDYRFNYEPAYSDSDSAGFSTPQAAVALNTWQTWDAFSGGWYVNSYNGYPNLLGSGPGTNVKSFAALVAAADAQSIAGTPTVVNGNDLSPGFGGVRLVSGYASAGDNFNTYVSDIAFGISGVTTTYDFENVAPSTLLVNSAWAGTSPGTDPDGAGPATNFGGDSFATISAAVAAAQNGNTIQVAAGNYAEQVTVNKSLTILGAQAGQDARVRSVPLSAESVTTGVAGSTVFTIAASGVTIDGFVVQGSTNPNLFGASIYMQPGFSGTQLKNNIIQDNIVGVFAANNNASSPAVIQRNLFRDNTQNPAGAASGHSIYADNSTAGGALLGLTVDNNTFTNTSLVVGSWTLGMSNGGTTPFSNISYTNNTVTNHGRGAYFYNTKDSVVSGNTISGTTNYAVGIFDFAPGVPGSTNIAITNNTLTNNFRGIWVDNFPNSPVDAVAYAGALNLSDNTITGGVTGLSIIDPNITSVNLGGVTVSGTSTPSTIQIGGSLSYTGGIGNESIVSSSASFAVSGGSTIQAISLTGVTQQILNGNAGDDTFDVTPSAGVSFNIDGGAPATAPGDLVIYRGTGLTGVVDNGSSIAASGVGAVNYLAVERITLDGVTAPNVTPGGGNDAIRLFVQGGITYYQVGNNQPIAIPNATSITVEGGNGNDTFTIDYTGGDPIPASGITFNGGDPTMGTGDTLVIKGTGSQNPTYKPDPAVFGNGSIVIGGKTISFTGLEPVDFDNVGNFTLNLPNSNDVVTLADGFLLDGTTPAVVISGTSNGVAFETARVRAGSITVDTVTGGTDGNDTITVSGVQATAAITSLSILTGVGTDSVAINGTTVLSGGLTVNTAGALSGAGDISVGGAASLTAAGVNLTGVVTVTGNTTVAAGANVVSLANTSNDFGGDVAITASDLTVVDVDDLTLGAVTASAGQVVTLSTDLNINAAVSATGNIVLQPSPLSQTIGLGGGAGAFTLTEAELLLLSTGALVAIGRADMGGGTGAVDINNLNLSAETYDLTVRGGSMSLDSITLGNNKTLTLVANGGSISDTNLGTANITIGGGTGTAILTSATGIGSGDSLETNIDRLSATATTSGNVQIIEANSLTIDNPVSATGGSVSVQATGTLTTTASGTITAGAGTVFLFANDMVLGAAINGSNGVELRTVTAGTQITLGTGATGLALSNAELNLITVGGSQFLTVGNSGAGAATIDSAITLTSIAPRLRVLTSAGISFTSTGALSVTSGVELDGSTITTTSSATSVITAPSSVNLLARTTGIGSDTNPITLAGTSSLSALTTSNADAYINTGTASGVQSLNAGSGFVEFKAGTFNLNGSNVINDATQIRLNGGTSVMGVGANSDTIGGLHLKSGDVTGSGTLTSASTYLVEGGSISTVLAGATGTVGLTKVSAGTVTLSGANTFTGPVAIDDSNLILNNAAGTALHDGVAVSFMNVANAALTLNFSETIGTLSGGGTTGGNVNLNGRTLTVGGSTSTTFGGALNGATAGSAFVKSGSSNLNLTGTSSVVAGTQVTGGTLRVNGSLTSNVSVTSPATLGGSGTVTGNVTGTGTVAPGNTPGILNVVGTFGPVGTLAAEINGIAPGTQHDQVNVTGSVNLGGTTVLSTTGSTITSVPGQQIVLINNDLTDAVTGTFSGIAEGATTTVNGLMFVVSYIGGLNGNDVTLTQAGAITITGTAGADGLLIQEETILGLDYISYYLNSVLQTRWLSSAVTTITVNAGDGNDTLTVNYGASGGFFNKTVIYNGGNQTGTPGDTLVLDDTGTPPSFTSVHHSFTDNSTGNVQVDGALISYSGLEPITDNLNAANRQFTFTGSDETITLTSAGAGVSQIDSTQGESVVFTHPTTSMTITSNTGTDTLNFSSIGSGFSANVTVTTGFLPFGSGTINFDSANLDFGSGNVEFQSSNSVNFTAGALTTTGTVTLNSLGAGGVTANAAGVDITAASLSTTGGSALGAIGSSANPLRTSVGLLNVNVSGAGAGVFVTETDAITLANVITTDGAITITAGGTITATGVGAGGTSRNARLTTTGAASDIDLGFVSADGDLVSLNAGGAITDGNGSSNNIASATLALQATTGIGSADAIETALTGSAQFAFVNTTSGNVQVTNTGTLNVFQVDGIGGTGVNASRNLGGAVTLTALTGDLNFVLDATSSGDFTIRTPENGAGSSGQNDVTFDSALVTSTGGNIVIESGDDINGGNFAPLLTLNAAGHIRLRSSFSDADGDGGQNWSTAHISAGSYIALEVGAATDSVSQSADSRFIAPSLELRGLGATANSFVLDGTNNDVDTLAGSTRGVIRCVDVDGLTIGTVNGIGSTVGLSNALGTAAITLTTGGALLIDDDVSSNSGSGAGSIRLNVTGTITQNSGDDITGFGLALSGTGTTTLTNTGNNVVEFASNRDGELAYTDASDLHLDSVAGLNGVQMGTNTLTFTTSGTLDQEGATGNLVAGNVRILGSGNVSLPTAARNAVGTLAISRTSGIVDFTDSDALTIGTVTGTLGASAGTTSGVLTTGNITLATNTLALTLDQNVTTNTTGTTVRLQGATDLIQNATSVVTGANLGARAVTGSIDLDSINLVGTFASASGTTTVFRNGQALVVDQVSGFSGFTPTATGMTGTDLEVVTTAGGIQFARASTASGTFRIQAGGGNVTQTGTSVLSAANLGARATGNIDLNTATNTVSSNFAAVSTGTGFIEFLDAGGFTVGTVSAGQFFTTVTGVTTTDGLIDLNTSGNLTVTDVVTAVGTGRNVTLTTTAGGNVALNGIVTANGDVVNITSAGNITDSPANTVNNITAATINLNAATGIGGSGINAALETTAATVNATNTTSGGIFLNSLSVVNFNNINAQTTGNIELTSDLAATLTTVNADSGNIGATVNSGNLTVASSVTAGGAGDIDFVALSGNIVLTGTTTASGDDVTMVSSGNITGNGLVTGNSFSALASTGIGVSTSNRVQTSVSLIRMGVTGGSIFVNNTSTSLTTFSLASPAGTGITASGVVDLTTSSDLTVANGALVVAGGTATLQGGAANGGATIFLNDTVDGTTVTVLGGTGADSIFVNDMSATNVLNLDGRAGSDSYTINYGSAFMPSSTANIDVEDTSTGVDSDVININGTNAVDSFNVKEDAQLAGNFRTTITGGHTGRVNYFAEPLTTAINAGLTRVNVSSLGEQDFFFVAPSRFFEIFLFGGLPSFGPALTDVPQVGVGDTLDFDPYGNTFTIDIRTFLTDGGTPAFQGVSFSNIENVPLTPIGTGSRFFDFDRVDLGSGTGTSNPLPSAYSPLATGYERVIERDLYIPTDLAYTDIMGRPGYSDPAKRYGWEVVGIPEVMADGRIRGPVKGYEYTGNTTELAASQFGDVVRDGNWSTDQNTNAIFRFEMPSANSWYLVSAKVGQRNGAIDQVRIRNASTGYLLAQNISTTVNNIAEVKFPVKTDANGVIRLQFEDAGGQHPWWFLAGLEVRPGKILSFGGPPMDLVADGQTVDVLTAYNLSQNAIVTINPTYGTAVTTGAFPDVDPVMNGYQRPTIADPMNPGKFIVQYTVRRPSGPGFAYIAMGEVSTGFTGDVIGDTGSQEINYIAPPTRRFDFGSGTSPVQAPVATASLPGGYIGVGAGDVYTSTSGYGWSSPVTAGDIGAGPVTGSAFANLLRDYNYATSARNFILDLPAAGAGGDVYDLVAIVGDAGTSSLANQTISVVGGGAMVNGTEVMNYSYNGGTWKALRFTVNRTGNAPLQLQFSGGASGQRWQINGLELRLATTVAAVSVTPPGGTPSADGTTIDTFNVSAAGLTGRTLSLSIDNGTITAVNGTPVASADADAFFNGLQFVPGADNFTVSVRRPGSASTATLTVQDVTGAFRGTGSQTYAAVAAGVARQFDFGATTSVAPAGYTLVTPSSTYSTALGFGWQNSVNASDVGTLTGTTNANLLVDSISASIGRAGLFRVDLPNGTYQVTAVLGDPSSNRNGMQVRWSANGGTSYTTGVSGVTTVGGQFTHVTFPITVTGGNVLLEFSSTLSPFIWRAASLEIRSAAGTVSVAGPAGPVAGDGSTDVYTVTGGTPNATYTITNSLGTLVTADADTRFTGVQVVADGAGSFTFQVMRPITSGTNSITVTEVTGARTGAFTTTYSVAGTRSFDFNGSNNITEAGFIGVRANVIFSTTVGYGWLVAQTERDNGTPASNLLRDGHIGTSGTFRVVATPGLTYTLTMQFRDTTTRNITITGEGVAPVVFTVPANTTVSQTINLPVSASADGMLDLLVARTGTTGTFIINSLVVATPQLAEGGFGAGSSALVSEADLADVIAAAKDRWLATGLSPEQMLALNGVRFEVSDLGVTGGAYVGLAYSPSLIKIDDDAAGWGWFIDSTPSDDSEFLPSGPSSLAALAGAGGRFDLLTVVMHELGNALKLSGLGTPDSASGLMGTTLGVGTRRLPGAVRGTVADATSSSTTTSTASTGLTLALDDRTPVGGSTKVAAPASATVDTGVTAPIPLPKRAVSETSALDAVFSLASSKPVLDDLWAE
jgi:hypothetical protein